MDGIGIATGCDEPIGFVTDLAGSIIPHNLIWIGRQRPIARAQGNLSGIAYAEKL